MKLIGKDFLGELPFNINITRPNSMFKAQTSKEPYKVLKLISQEYWKNWLLRSFLKTNIFILFRFIKLKQL